MPIPEHIASKVAKLDAAAQVLVEMIWLFHEEQMSELKAQNERFRKMIFGARSEKMPSMRSEVRRAVEAEDFPLDLPDDASEEDAKAAAQTARRKRGRAASTSQRKLRKKDLSKLPAIHQELSVEAQDLPQGLSCEDFRRLGKGRTVTRVEHVREHLVVVHYRLEKLEQRGGELIIEAKPPLNVVDGGQFAPSVYAHVAVSKCVDSMPLYRIERALGRAGFSIARSVLCGLFHKTAEALEPIYQRLLGQVRLSPYVQADETRLRVAEAHNARTAWMWTLLSEHIIAYVFSETRSGETASALLGGTQGHLVTDGYAGYNGVVGEGQRTRVGCWAHARRKFFEALATSPEAQELLDLIVKLYRVEHEAADAELLGSDAHKLMREEQSAPIVDAIEAWVDTRKASTSPKSPLGVALTYADNQRAALRVFLTDAKLPLDNNSSENALRIVAMGRKNFLFVGHEEGGHNLAILQTICSTCALHGINPYEYIRDVIVRVRTHPNSAIDELLPVNWKPPPELLIELP